MFETNNTGSDMMSFFMSLGARNEVFGEISYIKNFSSLEDEMYSYNNGVALKFMNTSSIIELK